MNDKKLRALLTAVQCGSFGKATAQLGYTQSGLTHMMNSLEKDIGFPLLERGRRGGSVGASVPLIGIRKIIHSAPPFSYPNDTKKPDSQTARKLPVFCPQTALKIFGIFRFFLLTLR